MTALPLPFSERPLADWVLLLQQAPMAEDRLRALQAVGHLCSVDELTVHAIKTLTDSDPMIRALAAKLLGRDRSAMSPDSAARLTSLLSDDDPDVRFESARALIRNQKTTEAVPVIAAFLNETETHPILLAAILNTLVEGNLSDEQVQQFVDPRLNEFLNHDRAEVREAAALAFTKWPKLIINHREGILEALDDEEPVVRERMAIAIGCAGLNDEAIMNAIRTATQDEDPEVARVATEAYQSLSGDRSA